MYLSTNNVSICWDTLHEYTDTVHNTTDENSSTGLLPDLNVLNEHVSKDVWVQTSTYWHYSGHMAVLVHSCADKGTGMYSEEIKPCSWYHKTILKLLLHPFSCLFSRTTWVRQYQKGKTSLDLNEARDLGFGDGTGISCTIRKQSAPLSRQITTPTPHHLILQAACSSWCLTNSVKALKENSRNTIFKSLVKYITRFSFILATIKPTKLLLSWKCCNTYTQKLQKCKLCISLTDVHYVFVTSCGTSCMRSSALMWSNVSMDGDKPPCKQNIYTVNDK